jgi:hypothetical protein
LRRLFVHLPRAVGTKNVLKLLHITSEVAAMGSISRSPRSRYRDTLASRVGWRTEVCPPSLRQVPDSTWNRFWFRLMGPGALQASPPPRGLPPVRHAFRDALADVAPGHAGDLFERVERARTLRELWHLRTDLYQAVARQHCQLEAERRLAQLNPHFPTRAPRSGFVPLFP